VGRRAEGIRDPQAYSAGTDGGMTHASSRQVEGQRQSGNPVSLHFPLARVHWSCNSKGLVKGHVFRRTPYRLQSNRSLSVSLSLCAGHRKTISLFHFSANLRRRTCIEPTRYRVFILAACDPSLARSLISISRTPPLVTCHTHVIPACSYLQLHR